jgi:signal transduction histidine kinase
MRRFNDLALQSKLVMVMVGTSVLAMGVAFLAYFAFEQVASRSEVVRQARALAEIVGTNSAAALTFGDRRAGTDTLASLRLQPGIVAARLFDSKGRPFATFRQASRSHAMLPDLAESDGTTVSGGRLRVFHKVAFRGELVGTVFLEIDLHDLRARQAYYALVLLLLMLGSVGAAALAAHRLQALISRPVLDLAVAAGEVAAGKKYSLRVPVVHQDEVGELTGAFNQMMEQIEARDEELRATQAELQARVHELEREIAERKLAEEALRQSEAQLAHAQRMEAIGILAGGVAHDFNNLLQALLAQLQLLRRNLPAGEGHWVALTNEIEEQIQHGAALTRQLLLFSRRETAVMARVDINDLVKEGSRMIQRLIRATIQLSVDTTPGPLLVKGDRGQLLQVVINLAINASEAMPGGGQLTICSGRTDDRRPWLAVKDSGEGIPDEIRGRIFEPFFTTKTGSKGTGLGLSVVHGIVAKHGGSIDVRSAAGQGTIITVVFPPADASRSERGTELSAALEGVPLGHHERILVVEDERGTREALGQLLEGLGYEVETAASGEEAGLLPVDPPFAVLVTDLMLPGVAGPDLARGLAERWPGLRVILMSGYTEDEAIRREVGDGGVRFLQKPFDIGTLARELRATLEG